MLLSFCKSFPYWCYVGCPYRGSAGGNIEPSQLRAGTLNCCLPISNGNLLANLPWPPSDCVIEPYLQVLSTGTAWCTNLPTKCPIPLGAGQDKQVLFLSGYSKKNEVYVKKGHS